MMKTAKKGRRILKGAHLSGVLRILALSCCTLWIASCGTPTHVDTGPIHAETFCFVNISALPDSYFSDNRQMVHTMIQNSISKNLTEKGLSRVETGGDLTIAYLIIIGNNVGTTAINEYFGYGRDAEALHDRAYKAYTGTKSPNLFEAGTLLIDIIDSKSFKLVSRNYAVRPLLRNPSAEVRAEHIQGAVDEALQQVRVAK